MINPLKNYYRWIILLAIITFLQLYPYSFYPQSKVHDVGDPLLNCYILYWIGYNFFHNPLHLFEANYYYPHHNALAFSDHMLPLALMAYPFYILSKNPILSYNIVLLLSFILNAVGMLLLAKKLTNDSFSAFISALIFSFSSYKIMHVSHIQLLSSMWIPFYFLYLHRFMEQKKLKDSLLFSLFLILQALSSVYYGLFSFAILLIILPLFIIFYFKKDEYFLLYKLFFPIILSSIFLLLIHLPYIQIFKNFGFKRPSAFGAELQNYLAPHPQNIIFGSYLSFLGSPEKFLFPGFTALTLLILYLIEIRKNINGIFIDNKILKIIKIIFLIFSIANLFFILYIVAVGRVSIKTKVFKFSVENLASPVFNFLLILILCFLFKIIINYSVFRSFEHYKLAIIYFTIILWGLLLSFGKGFVICGNHSHLGFLPFNFFYNYIIGFKGIREPARFAVFVIFAISILAGLALAKLSHKISNKSFKYFLAIFLIIFINVEYLCIPLRSISIPVYKEIPPTYEWIKNLSKDAVILEYPFISAKPKEAIYMYFSIYHRKKIINGYSGYNPCSSNFLMENFSNFPNRSTLEILKKLKVDYVILHLKMLKNKIDIIKILNRIERRFPQFKLIKRFQYDYNKEKPFQDYFGDDIIYELQLNDDLKKDLIENAKPLREINLGKASFKFSKNSDLAIFMIDNNFSTSWNSGEAKNLGQFIQMDFGRAERVSKISLYTGEFCSDFGINFNLKASMDGKTWKEIPIYYSKADYLMQLYTNQKQAHQDIWINDIETRYIKIYQRGMSEKFLWSVSELKVYTSL